MKRLEEIINSKAEFNKWLKEITESELDLIKEISREYAEECCQASLQKASENAEARQDWGECDVDVDSITNESNITLL
jgi:hypothetical protein